MTNLPQDDCFVVFVREQQNPWHISPERELVKCATYAQARWVSREFCRPDQQCIIRYVGPAGGGD